MSHQDFEIYFDNTHQVVRGEGLIYMVLEYGDIDLARLLDKRQRACAQHGSKELDGNFMRLYWQQMLQVRLSLHATT